MAERLKAPMPYTGGKASVAADVWRYFGDVPNYVEPMCGSAAVLLARPHDLDGKTETCNDSDGLLVNALRSIAFDPEQTAYWCDWNVSEADLTARHLYLKAQRDDLTARLMADPFYHDPMLGAWWLWGAASWIGDGWCVADGPWINLDGRLVDRRTIGADTEGVTKKMPDVSPNGIGRGVTAAPYRAAPGVPRKMPEVGRSPNGQMDFNRKGVQAYRYREGVPRQMPKIGANGAGVDSGQTGVRRHEFYTASTTLFAYFDRLAQRLRRVRLLCGDWRRAVKDSITVNHGTTGLLVDPLSAIFLDPPYPEAEHSMAYHGEAGVWWDAAHWAVEHGDDPRLRICVAGYMSDAADAVFPASWTRYRWAAKGGYANQAANGRGRANARRECLWFNRHCIDPENDWVGTLFEEAANAPQ